MTIAYQPSAAGISWLTLSQTLDSRAQMEKDLLALSGENSKVQINMTENSSDQTLKELKAAAEGQKQNAMFTMAGAGLGIATSAGTFVGAVKTMPQEEETQTLKMGTEEEKVAEPAVNPLKLEEMPTQEGVTQINAQNEAPSSQAPTAPAKETATEKKNTSSNKAALNKYLSEHGYLLASMTQTSIQSFGGIQQARYAGIQAEAKSIEVIAQGLASVMNAQGGMLSSAIGSSDAFFNNTESAITTIIQVSAIRA